MCGGHHRTCDSLRNLLLSSQKNWQRNQFAVETLEGWFWSYNNGWRDWWWCCASKRLFNRYCKIKIFSSSVSTANSISNEGDISKVVWLTLKEIQSWPRWNSNRVPLDPKSQSFLLSHEALDDFSWLKRLFVFGMLVSSSCAVVVHSSPRQCSKEQVCYYSVYVDKRVCPLPGNCFVVRGDVSRRMICWKKTFTNSLVEA